MAMDGHDRVPSGTLAAPALLERESEISHLCQVLGRAREGSPETVLIEGPSGIGKSRLLDEASLRAHRLGMQVLRARADEGERDYPFGVVIRLFEARFARATGREHDQLFRGWARLARPALGYRRGRAARCDR
jgi:predicted ATPase